MKPLLIPLFGSAVGAWVASQFGVPWTAFVPNVVGLGIGFLILRFARPISSAVAAEPELVARVAVGILVLTLVFPGVEGVRRWISIGQFRLNASMALTPLLLAAFARIKRSRDLIPILAVAAVHFAQPDAGQATVFALGVSVSFLIRQGTSPLYRIAWPIALLTLAFLTFLTWRRPDPLAPVRHVEGVLHLAASLGNGATLAAGLAVALALLPFLRPKRTLGAAYLVLLLGSFAVTWLGNFPVPLLGAGAASIIAWCLMVALEEGRPHSEV